MGWIWNLHLKQYFHWNKPWWQMGICYNRDMPINRQECLYQKETKTLGSLPCIRGFAVTRYHCIYGFMVLKWMLNGTEFPSIPREAAKYIAFCTDGWKAQFSSIAASPSLNAFDWRQPFFEFFIKPDVLKYEFLLCFCEFWLREPQWINHTMLRVTSTCEYFCFVILFSVEPHWLSNSAESILWSYISISA